MRRIFDRAGKLVDLGSVVGRGGEAVVYSLAGEPGWIAKLYEPAPRPNYPAKLAWMLEHPPADPTAPRGHPSLAWPAALLYDQGHRLAGYRMPYIQGAAPVLVVFNPRRRKEALPQFDRRYLHHTACNLATAVAALHQSSYVIGDLNESNILVKSSALVSLIDTDSFQVQEPSGGRMVTHACPVAKPEYTPPELQGRPLASVIRTPEQDAFGLGVLIFQLLMEGNHPFRAQWLGKGDPPPVEERIAIGAFPYTSTPGIPVCPPKHAPDLNWLHPALTELIRRCFVDGHQDPGQRPSASAWARAIAEAENSLVQCPNRHIYSGHLSACPYCHSQRAATSGSARSTTTASSRAAASSASKSTGSSAASHRVPPTGARPGQGSATAGRAAAGQPGAAPSGNPSRQGASARPPVNARHAWNTFRYWQSQSQQTGSGPGNQAGQVKAAWNTWKYWQAGQASTPNQPPSAGSAKSQTPPSPAAGAAQASGTTANMAGARPAPPPNPNPSRAQPPGSAPSPHSPGQPPPAGSAKSQTPPPAAGAARASATTANTAGAHQAPPPNPNPAPARQTRPGPSYHNPSWSTNTSSSPGMASNTPAATLLNWAGPRLYKSLAIGGGLGALVGALSGASIGVAGWLTAGNMMSWVMLWAIGGASAGLLRGWRPGYRVSLLVDRSIGWQRLLPVLGVVLGAGIGGALGMAVCWWAIIPIFIGLYFGGKTGLKAGNKLWLFGAQYGWERIWACIGALCAGFFGWRLALWLGAGSLSTHLFGSFATWISAQSPSLVLIALAFGALGGALGGAIAGTLADLLARTLNLLD
jgi:serine/threonine protein kinase